MFMICILKSPLPSDLPRRKTHMLFENLSEMRRRTEIQHGADLLNCSVGRCEQFNPLAAENLLSVVVGGRLNRPLEDGIKIGLADAARSCSLGNAAVGILLDIAFRRFRNQIVTTLIGRLQERQQVCHYRIISSQSAAGYILSLHGDCLQPLLQLLTAIDRLERKIQLFTAIQLLESEG